ncbi:NAD-dependent epimerase/dehydratase family protein [Roseiconus lacunae]|uniref:NAD-dependent epimerase/dehydratase family protein n=1 Tax=Roseiconus lacunae TaxID=2605694 RepID=UPI0011F3E042|nr:SDR family oxidoreductase [Roseiconus lacunae]MCD0458413.1 SDR family oxidoreductase [Roseiconus lacunae]
MRIALTGATGFLGRYLIRELAKTHDVQAWHRGEKPPVKRWPVLWITGQLGDAQATKALVEGVDAVIHSGLHRTGESMMDAADDPVEYWQRNATGSLQLLEAAHQAGVKRFVFVSSGAVHDDVLPHFKLDETHPLRPNTLYGAYKASVETLVHHYGKSSEMCCVSVRPTAIYGVADPVKHSKWFDLIQSVAAGQAVTATGGSKSVHAQDVAKACHLLMNVTGELDDAAISGETFNCCDRMISDFQVASIAREISGSSATIEGPEKVAKNAIVTGKLQSLGIDFGGEPLLRKTVEQLLAET